MKLKGKLLSRMALFVASCAIFSVGGAFADTVSFDGATQGPANSLTIGGVTITGYNGLGGNPGQAASVTGGGLGSANGVGPIDEIDRQQYYSSSFANGLIPQTDTGVVEGLNLQVNGVISSITILPVFRIYDSEGNLVTGDLPFSIYIQGNASTPQGSFYQYLSGTSPITINFNSAAAAADSSIWIDISDGEGEYSNFQSYRQQNAGANQTFQFGITILSMNYSPVPEPSTVAMTTLGLGALWLLRRLRK